MPDSLDIENRDLLLTYLRETRRIDPFEEPQVRTLAGGVSNRTVLLERDSGESWVLKQALHKLRTAADWYCDPSRVDREAMGLRQLVDLAPAGTTTPLVFEDPTHHLLAMKAVPKPHENWKAMLLVGRVEDDHIQQFATLLASIHREAAGRGAKLQPLFCDRCFFESLRLEPYYEYAAQQTPQAADFLHTLVADTRNRQLTLVHGDYSPKNVLVYEGRLVLLDHEVIHWGDPAFDVGFAMTHLLSKAHHLARHRELFARAAKRFWTIYIGGVSELNDPELETLSVRHTLGCLLARVAGRSPLEYLTAAEVERQRDTCLRLIKATPPTVEGLVSDFLVGIGESR